MVACEEKSRMIGDDMNLFNGATATGPPPAKFEKGITSYRFD